MTQPLRFSRTAIVGFIAFGAIALHAQIPPAPQTPPAAQTPGTAPSAFPKLTLTSGRSMVLSLDFDVEKVAINNPAIVDGTMLDAREMLLDGKTAGTTSLIVFGPGTQRVQYDVVVDPGVSALQRQLQTLFPGEDIQANETPDAVILTGHASTNVVMLRAGEIAEAVAPKAKIINLLQLPGGNISQQVMLQVRIAEVNRRALTELGSSVFTGGTGVKNVVARGTTEQFPAPNFDALKTTRDADGNLISSEGQLTFTDFLNLFVFSNKYNVGTLIRALQTTGNFQSLAEPNLIAYNGVEASFLAGGELPIPITQGNTGAVSVQYKEFGIKLTFRPTIAGDVIRLKVTPEVSQLDFANGVSVGGVRIPALTTRRATTDVELRDGQSFAIGGLMNNTTQDQHQKVPVLGSIPLLGKLFQSKNETKDRTELLVLVTPHLVRPMNPDEVPPLPTLPAKFLPPCDKPPCGPATPPKKSGGN